MQSPFGNKEEKNPGPRQGIQPDPGREQPGRPGNVPRSQSLVPWVPKAKLWAWVGFLFSPLGQGEIWQKGLGKGGEDIFWAF